MQLRTFVVVAIGLAACARGQEALPDGRQPGRDAPPTGADARALDAPPGRDAPPSFDGASAGAGTLLLGEIALAPSGHEFVEIVNPTDQAVDLATYYLSDNGNYFKLPAGTPALTTADFIVKFPAGASLAPHAVATVALASAAAFTTAFGIAPTYSIADGTMTDVAVQGTPTLTDSGEIVVLFQWDGVAPLVKDVDLVLAGVPSSGNGLVSKSNAVQGTGAYAADANTIAAQASAPGSGKSTQRIALEAGHETQDGTGNGITGDDETSEDTSATWDFAAPTPGTSPVQ